MKIGQLDTGVDGAHPALAGRVERFRCFAANGFSDEEAEATDGASHGTHTAGLMVGGVCEGRLIGIAPAARLHCGAVIEAGNIVARTLLGLDWLAESGVSVVNLSLGVPGATPVFRSMLRALARRDILVVCPIGNGGAGSAGAPGCEAEVLSVGACGPDGRVARFSGSLNDPRTKACCRPDVVANGVGSLSLAAGGGTSRQSGTSAASAIVAGLAALLRQAFPRAPGAAIKRAIMVSAEPLGDDQSHRARHGRVRLLAAFAALEQGITADADETPDLALPEKKFVDPRLAEQLTRVRDDDPAQAILEFSTAAAADEASLRLRAEGDGQQELRVLKNAAVIILRARASTVRELLETPSVVIASACDIERAFL